MSESTPSDLINPAIIRRQADMLASKVKKRFRHLAKRFARQNIEVFRLYDWDIPEIRAVVDWYGGHLVIGEYNRAQSTPQWLPMMAAAVAHALEVPPERVHLKQRRYGAAGGRRYQRLAHTEQMLVVRERDLRFYVNPHDYVDTGLFADHRDTRQRVREESAGRHFLNLFCYSGAFTCYAARGGALSTTSVDRSRTAIQWVRRNMDLNGLHGGEHQLVQAHVPEFLSKAQRAGVRYDLAVVDPPSFYSRRSGEDHFDIADDHPGLLNAVIQLLRPGAILWFSTNHQRFTPRMEAVHAAEIEEMTRLTIPEDYRHKRKQIHRCWRMRV